MPGPPPVTVSIASLTALLQTRLGDTGVFWPQSELDLYVRQAIREFQVLTNYWRQKVQFSTTASGDPFYDLHAAGVIPYTVNDTDILAQVAYHLLEYDGTQANFINTAQFTQGAVTAAFDQRREELLGETRLVVTEYAGGAAGPTPPAGRIVLSSGVIQIHRVDWFDSVSSTWNLVSRTDELGASGWSYQWPQSPSLPNGYSVAVTRPFEVQFIPPPENPGSVSLLITACEPYTFTGTPQLITIPDDSAYALPWGILASMLNQDAQSRDYRRARYAQKRFRDALTVLKTWPMVMNTYPGGLQYLPSTMFSLDHWFPGWRNATPGLPTAIALAGRNLLVVSPIADAIYNISLDCVVNSPGSTAARGTTFDCPGDLVTALLDNAQHLACFKMQGEEFEATTSLYNEFLEVAKAYADRERAQSINWNALRYVPEEEEAARPYETEAVEA